MTRRRANTTTQVLLLVAGLLCFQAALSAHTPADSWRNQGVINDSASPYAKLHSVPVRAVKMGEGFWSSGMRINVEKSIPSLLQQLEDHAILDNFQIAAGQKQGQRKGPLISRS